MNEIKVIEHKTNRLTKKVSLAGTFEISLKNKKNGLKKDKMVEAFMAPGPLTPKINPHYRFPAKDLAMLLMGIHNRDSIYLQGHSGTGKTELVIQTAARLNYNVIQVNFDGHLLRSDLIGDIKLQAGETKFRHGLVPLGFTTPGTILLFDEIDAVAPETAFVLQRALSGDRKMLLHETNELFELHPQNVIVATANTTGMGDESTLYIAGTNVQNFSFQNRWDTVIKLDYPCKDEEKLVLKSMFPGAEDIVINSVADVMEAARNGFKGGKLTAPLTIRDSIRWVQKISQTALPMLSAEYSFLHRMPSEDSFAVAELIQRKFDLPSSDTSNYVVRGRKVSL